MSLRFRGRRSGPGRRRALVATGAAASTLMLATALGDPLANAEPPSGDGVASRSSAEEGIAERADCGPGSRPESGIQGRVPRADRDSGRSQQGYECNLELVGQYQGEGATWVNPSYRSCAYMGTSFGGMATKESPGTQVVDVSDPSDPKLSANLTSPAMLTDTWETLKVNEKRGLLAGVSVGPGLSGLFFDVYDVKDDCAHPKLLNSFDGTEFTLPANVLGHEGAWAPDGRTYYASGLAAGSLTAIDVEDPAHPRIAFTGAAGFPANHGFSVSDDGDQMYVTRVAPAGVDVIDVSSIQDRDALPTIRQIGSVSWSDGLITQHTIPITYRGDPYLVAVDEFGAGGVRFIDISDATKPVVTDKLRLEIQSAKHVEERREDVAGNGLFGYDAHYCDVDRRVEPTRLACGQFQSGVRVFDIRDLSEPREVAYFNPPARVGDRSELEGSEHASGLISGALSGVSASDISNLNLGDPNELFGALGPADLTTDWCSSPPRFVGENQLWVTCQDNGFLALRFTNGAER